MTTQLKTTFICVESHPDTLEGGSTDKDIYLFFKGGSLKNILRDISYKLKNI